MDNEHLICPVCTLEFNRNNIYDHIVESHQLFLITYLTMYDLIDINQYFIPDEESNYEELSELCERLGNHHIGIDVDKLDSIAPVTILDSDKCKDEKCAICLEFLNTKEITRKLKICNHLYCSECIEIWFDKNHTCPICKIDVRNVSETGVNEID